MTTIATIADLTHQLWPLIGAEAWDAPGLTAGDPNWDVNRILIAVDAVRTTVDEAVAGDFDVLITHHPLLLRGVTSVAGDQYKGALLTSLIQAQCGLLSAHTNADVVESGATSVLARQLKLNDVQVIAPTASTEVGIGRVGELPVEMTLGELARQLADFLPDTASGVRVSGDWSQLVRRIALCSGAGDSLLNDPAVRAADVYITSDLRHHPAQESREQSQLGGGPALIDVSHWASEWLWCESAAAELARALPGVEVVVSDLNTDPWDFVVHAPSERPE